MSDDTKISEKQEFINGLYKDYEYSISKFDHHILFLSSGILTICLTFINQIVPLAEAKYISLFIISVVIATVTIIISLTSHYISSKLILKKINDAHKDIFDNADDKVIPFLNASQLVALILTIVVLSVFVITNILSTRDEKNIKRGLSMAENKNNNSQQVIIKKAMTVRQTPDSLISNSNSKPTTQNTQSQNTATASQTNTTATTTTSNSNSK